MSIELIVAVVGPESAGLVKRISSQARAHDGVWLNNKFVHLQGSFAGLFTLQMPEQKVDAFKQILVSEFTDYQFQFNQPSAAVESLLKTGKMTLEGEDRVGLTREITEVIENNGFKIENYESRRFAVTGIGKSVFRAEITLNYSDSSSPELLVKELENLSKNIRVEFTPL